MVLWHEVQPTLETGMKASIVICAWLLCATAGATPAKHHLTRHAGAAAAAKTPAKVATVPFGEAPSPGKPPPRSIPSKHMPGFMDDGASKEKK